MCVAVIAAHADAIVCGRALLWRHRLIVARAARSGRAYMSRRADVDFAFGVRRCSNRWRATRRKRAQPPARFAICSFVKQIAANLPISPATVSRILPRLGLNRMRDLEPAEPVVVTSESTPGDMIHIDIRKCSIELEIPSSVLQERLNKWKPREPRYRSGVFAKYVALVGSASEGALTTPT